jgi:DNA-binding beta-propeller fold protein YncE
MATFGTLTTVSEGIAPKVRRPDRFGLMLVIVLLLLAACSGGKKPALGAAEPADAPASTATPAGLVVKVGDAPEGIVYDPTTGLVAVAVRDPDRLILLDGTTLAVVKSVPLAGHARHLQLARPGGPVLVPQENANMLAVVALPSGAVTEIKTGNSPHDATAVDGGYVIGNEFGRSITIARSGQPEQTVTGLMQPGGLVDFGNQVAVVDVGNFTVSTYSVADGHRIAKVAAGRGPTHGVRTKDGQLVVVDTRGNQLLRYSESKLARTGALALPGAPYGLAADPAAPTVWVTLTARNQLVGFTVTPTAITEIARLDTVVQANTVAVEPGSHVIFVTGTRTGVVQRLTR